MSISPVTTSDLIILTTALSFTLLPFYFLIKNQLRRKHLHTSQRVFDRLFANINSIEISQQDRANREDEYGFVYGEITFEGFCRLLAITKPKPQEIFYDLGSGAGKAIFCSALLYDWKKCCGIELLPGLYQLSLDQLHQFPAKADAIQFIHDDFLMQDISDADVLFINATSFFEDFWHKIVLKLDTLKSGTRIIVTSKRLDERQYHLLDAQMLPMSWGMSSVSVYRKR